jgi:acyl transferase domain-containing protein
VLQIALVELLSRFGTTLKVVLGHSSGEIGAAYTADALTHESACKVAYFRGQVAEKLRATAQIPGAMISINIAESEVPKYLLGLELGSWENTIHIACVNSPTNVILSGSSDAIDLVERDMDQHGVFDQKLNTEIAYHSPAMHAAVRDYALLMGSLEGSYARSCRISSVTGRIPKTFRNSPVLDRLWFPL